MVQNERLMIKLSKNEYSLFIRQLLSNHFNHHNHSCPNHRSSAVTGLVRLLVGWLEKL